MKILYTSRLSVNSGRDGSARSDDGMLDIRLAFPRALGGSGEAANPEQLFVAGFAACYASSVRAAAAALGLPAPAPRVEAEGDLGVGDDGAFGIAAVRLTLHNVDFGERNADVLAEASRLCAYSNATRGRVAVDVRVATR